MYPGEVEIQPIATFPRVVFGHSGVFVGSPDWYRRLEYPEDALRRVEAEEDLWTPGSFELELLPGKAAHFVVGVGGLPSAPFERHFEDTVAFLRAQDPGDERPPAVRELSIAAEQFCADACEHPAVVAGYPWLTVLSRDELVALPGLYLVRGNVEGARRVLREVVDALCDDLVPRRIRSVETTPSPPSVDATLWLFEAVRHLAAATGPSDVTVKDVLYPALRRIFRHVLTPGSSALTLSPDGLVVSRDDDVAFTWMNAHTGATTAATPRRGLPVELQALWTKGCETLTNLARAYGDVEIEQEATTARARARASFAARFWCEATRYPYDCLRSVDDADGPIMDASIRPNALVALDVDPDLFERWQAVAILERVRERLLTVRGVRSLDPNQPGYRGEYEGTFEERAIAYHQGLAWTHLLGAYARASLRLAPDDFELQENLRVRIEEARAGGPVLGQVSQFADGEPPHRAGGCPAQATSVAELLRTLAWDLGL
jgi:predicted glycogen debranching enzyme